MLVNPGRPGASGGVASLSQPVDASLGRSPIEPSEGETASLPSVLRDTPTHVSVSAPPAHPFEYKLDGLREWVEQERVPAVRTVKEKVVKNFAMVSDEAFEAACRDAAHFVARALEQIEPHKIMVLKSNAPESSNGWVFERCGDSIVREGTACSYFLGGWEKMKGYPTLSQAVLQEGRTHFVVFDDVSYSGTQITQRWLNHVADFARKNPGVQLEVFYVCGFATTSSEEVVSRFNQDCREQGIGVQATLVTGKNIPLVMEYLSPEERETLRGAEPDVVFRTTTTVFQHKLADDHSVLDPVRRRLLDHQPLPPYKATSGRDGVEIVSPYVRNERELFAQYKAAVYGRGEASFLPGSS